MSSKNDRMRFVVVGIVAAMVLGGGSAKGDFTFGEPNNLGPTINTSHYDEAPCISADGLELYFTSSRPNENGKADIWVARRLMQNDPWGEPVNLGPAVNSGEDDSGACISSDGLSLYFYRGSYPERDIYVTMRTTKDDPWGEAVNLGPIVNSPADELRPSISPNGLELFFNSDRSAGQDPWDWDIWVTTRPTTEDDWSEPVNLGPVVNSTVFDSFPTISADGLALFFRSDREPGGEFSGDMWVTRRRTISDPWRQPIYIGPIDDSGVEDYGLAFSPDGSVLYFNSEMRSGSFGGWDLWQAAIIPIVDLNDDGIVDAVDMCIMVDYWGTDEPLCDIGPMPWGDGIVDVQDLIVLAEHLFEEFPPAEPVE